MADKLTPVAEESIPTDTRPLEKKGSRPGSSFFKAVSAVVWKDVQAEIRSRDAAARVGREAVGRQVDFLLVELREHLFGAVPKIPVVRIRRGGERGERADALREQFRRGVVANAERFRPEVFDPTFDALLGGDGVLDRSTDGFDAGLSTTTTSSGLLDDARTRPQVPSATVTRTPLTVTRSRIGWPITVSPLALAASKCFTTCSTTRYLVSSSQCGDMVGDDQVLGSAFFRSAMLFPGLRSSMSQTASANTSPSS